MNLDDKQTKQVTQWLEEGARLSEIQNRMAAEFKVSLTYMEVRLLVDDLRLTPKDAASALNPPPPQQASGSPNPIGAVTKEEDVKPAGVSVSVDQLARPGAIVSGKVTFSDGQSAEWSLDQMGRLGFAPKQKGYKPSQSDVQDFQSALQTELTKLGF